MSHFRFSRAVAPRNGASSRSGTGMRRVVAAVFLRRCRRARGGGGICGVPFCRNLHGTARERAHCCRTTPVRTAFRRHFPVRRAVVADGGGRYGERLFRRRRNGNTGRLARQTVGDCCGKGAVRHPPSTRVLCGVSAGVFGCVRACGRQECGRHRSLRAECAHAFPRCSACRRARGAVVARLVGAENDTPFCRRC